MQKQTGVERIEVDPDGRSGPRVVITGPTQAGLPLGVGPGRRGGLGGRGGLALTRTLTPTPNLQPQPEAPNPNPKPSPEP